MQSRFFKRLMPFAAVALLILAFLAIEVERHATLVACKKQAEEKAREPLATTQPEYLSYEEAFQRAENLLPKYKDLFWRQPNVIAVQVRSMDDEDFNPIEVPDGKGVYRREVGIGIYVTKKVDQCALNPENRIPDTIEGVPVQIVEIILMD